MQRKILKPQKSQSFAEIEKKVMSFLPVNRNGWWIKFSTNKDSNILLLFTSMFTGQTIVRFFQEEDEAVKFINFITEQNPAEKLTL
jgi:hypothetical protein